MKIGSAITHMLNCYKQTNLKQKQTFFDKWKIETLMERQRHYSICDSIDQSFVQIVQ